MASVAKADYYPGRSPSSSQQPAEDGTSTSERPFTRPFVIGVAGASASGKTSVCQKIIAQLQQDEALEHRGILSLSQDCFYKDLPPGTEASTFNFDHPQAFAFDEICATIEALKEGRAVAIPHYDFVTSARTQDAVEVAHADIILFDGILAFYEPALRSLFDVRIFVDVDADTCLVRRIKRDIVERGRDIMGVLQQYERTVKPSYERFILPTKRYADIIIPRGVENEVAIGILLQHLKLRLRSQLEAPPREAPPMRRINTSSSLV